MYVNVKGKHKTWEELNWLESHYIHKRQTDRITVIPRSRIPDVLRREL